MVRAKVQACRRRSAVEHIRAFVTALACAWRQCMASHAETIILYAGHALSPCADVLPPRLLTIFFFQLKKENSNLDTVTVL
jgi:hypothetical protein